MLLGIVRIFGERLKGIFKIDIKAQYLTSLLSDQVGLQAGYN